MRWYRFFVVLRDLVGRSLAWGRSGIIILGDAVFGSRFRWRSRPWESRFGVAAQKPHVKLLNHSFIYTPLVYRTLQVQVRVRLLFHTYMALKIKQKTFSISFNVFYSDELYTRKHLNYIEKKNFFQCKISH